MEARRLCQSFRVGPLQHGRLHGRPGRFPGSGRRFRRALEFRPGIADVEVNLGGALSRQGKLPEAIEHFRRTLAIAPNDAMAHNNLGYALSQQSRLAEAAEQLREALRLQPNCPDARRNLEAITTATDRPGAVIVTGFFTVGGGGTDRREPRRGALPLRDLALNAARSVSHR